MAIFKEGIEILSTNESLTLEDLRQQNFVLYFYPKNDTSACTVEAIGFRELYDDFRALGFEVYGVSKDVLKSHNRFKEKHNLPFHLISDFNHVLLELFEVIVDKKMYGKAVKGTERSTFVFKNNFELIKSFRKVDAKVHPMEVLDFIQDLT